MAKASPAAFADAKRRALRALSQQQPDGFVPDRIMFFNEDAYFTFRLSNLSDDHHIQRALWWPEIEQARGPFIEQCVFLAVEELARAQGESI